MEFDYDLFVIGGGSGGVRAARIASAEGHARVGLAEESRVGGTCVIRGCVPKKLMVFASEFPTLMADARAYGWDVEDGPFDWPRFRARLASELDRLEGAYRNTLRNAGVTVHDARAEIVDAHTVRLATGEVFRTRHILIATGGRPHVPDIPGRDLALVSDDMFSLPELPGRVLIVGGGFIACEFAGVLAGLGSAVTQAIRSDQILRGFDDEARAAVAAGMSAAGVDLRPQTEVLSLARSEGGIRAELTTGSAEFDAVLYATGRRPNVAGLGLDRIGITPDEGGAIPVDDYSQTKVPSVYAVGDVTNRVNLTPVAIREGQAFSETVFLGRPTRVDHSLVAAAVFTRPELGTIGLTEEAARAQGPIEVYAASFRPMQTLFAGREDRALFKLVVCANTRRVLGCHIVAPNAGELIQLVAIAVQMGATKEDFDRTMAVHPTIAEELVTMKTPARKG